MTDLERLTRAQELISSIESETITEVEITPKLLKILSTYEKLIVVLRLDMSGGAWVPRIEAQDSEGRVWTLPLAKD